MVAVLIKKQFGIKLSDSSVGRLLRQLGLSCQRPLFRAYQKNHEAIQEWKAHIETFGGNLEVYTLPSIFSGAQSN